MHPLISNKCKLFNDVAAETWDKVNRHHRNGIDPPEIGITAEIISRIRDEFNRDSNFGAWANPGYQEILHGSDVDIFVESLPGFFVWYAMQAKALKMNGRYINLRDRPNGEYQWEKLLRLQQLSDCMPYYLLYNGRERYSNRNLFDVCNRPFTTEQFGCSLVTVQNIKVVALRQDWNLNYINPRFEDLHPNYASPWRILTCCKPPVNRRLYSTNQIKNYVETYKLLTESVPFDFDEVESRWLGADGSDTGGDRNPFEIVEIVDRAGYDSKYVMMFRRAI